MEDNVFSEGDGSEEVQKSGTGEDGDRAEDKTPSQPSSSTKVSNNHAGFLSFPPLRAAVSSAQTPVTTLWLVTGGGGCLVLAR